MLFCEIVLKEISKYRSCGLKAGSVPRETTQRGGLKEIAPDLFFGFLNRLKFQAYLTSKVIMRPEILDSPDLFEKFNRSHIQGC